MCLSLEPGVMVHSSNPRTQEVELKTRETLSHKHHNKKTVKQILFVTLAIYLMQCGLRLAVTSLLPATEQFLIPTLLSVFTRNNGCSNGSQPS